MDRRIASTIVFPLILWVIALLTGCAGASVVSSHDEGFKATRLTSAHVVWVKKPVKINVTKSAVGYQPIITAKEGMDAQIAILTLTTRLEKVVPGKVQEQLGKNDVADAVGATIEIEPTSAAYVVGGARTLFLRVSVKESGAEKPVWSATIRTFGLLSQRDDVLVDDFVNAAVAELKRAGWLA